MKIKVYEAIRDCYNKYVLSKDNQEILYLKRNEEALKRAEPVLKDIELNHNHAWAIEVMSRIIKLNGLDDVALFYRGAKITYREMFDMWKRYGNALCAKGVQKGDEIPACMANVPELVYLLGGASLAGARLNIFGNIFDKDYITKIIDGCNSDILFATDDVYESIKDSINKSHIKEKVLVSLTDSLPNGKNPYQKLDEPYYDFKNKVAEFKKEDSSILSSNEFIADVSNALFYRDSNLDDVFTTTYSSGSTNSKTPKAIVHSVRSFITMGVFHDSKVSRTPSMDGMRVRASIPSHSNTDIISSISDALMQHCEVALEPIYNKDHHIISVMINKPNFDVSSKSFWLNTCKKIALDPQYSNIKMPFLIVPMAAGEPLSKGEEKFMNKVLRKIDAGKDTTHLPISPITFSVAGGDCEHGGIFFSLFRALQSKKVNYLIKGEPHGLRTYDMVEYAVLDINGNYLPNETIGRLVANSPCTMREYKNNIEATNDFFINSIDGKVWADCHVYAKVDSKNYIHMMGRIKEEDLYIPPFMIANTILEDTKNILSCEVVSVKDDNDKTIYVAHIEFMPNVSIDEAEVLLSADTRCTNKYDKFIMDRVVYRVRNKEESFPLSGCGKRNNLCLIAEGINEKCVKPIAFDDEIELINATEYLKNDVKVLNKRKK